MALGWDIALKWVPAHASVLTLVPCVVCASASVLGEASVVGVAALASTSASKFAPNLDPLANAEDWVLASAFSPICGLVSWLLHLLANAEDSGSVSAFDSSVYGWAFGKVLEPATE